LLLPFVLFPSYRAEHGAWEAIVGLWGFFPTRFLDALGSCPQWSVDLGEVAALDLLDIAVEEAVVAVLS
jgi:hypothetical protein